MYFASEDSIYIDRPDVYTCIQNAIFYFFSYKLQFLCCFFLFSLELIFKYEFIFMDTYSKITMHFHNLYYARLI